MGSRGGSKGFYCNAGAAEWQGRKLVKSITKCNITNLLFFSAPLPAFPESCSDMAPWSTPSPGKLLVEKEEQESNEVGAREVLM